MPSEAPAILVLSKGVPERTVETLRRLFPTSGPFAPAELEAFLAAHAPEVRGIATTGKAVLDRALIARLPALEIVASYSAGLDKIDEAALAERGIALTNSSTALAEEVADTAIALMLMARRRLARADRFLREGGWKAGTYPLGRTSTGKRIGILGLGHIGSAIARRAEAMGMAPRYCTRRPKPGIAYPYHPTPLALAEDSDVFVVACPGGPANRHLVDRNVIAALGPDATLVNIARGEIIEEAALVDALVNGRLGSAGLDVFENEPHVPEALLALDNVALLPHLGSATVETRAAMGDTVVEALTRHFGVGQRR